MDKAANDAPANTGPAHYIVKADMMQAIVSTLAALPYGQISGLMDTLRQVVAQQEAAHTQQSKSVDLKEAIAVATNLKKQRRGRV